ncbi:alpha/beta hydrolase [Bacillus tianshenii]|nr:alpha/beta hydrolase [Bacillus tianshenii]
MMMKSIYRSEKGKETIHAHYRTYLDSFPFEVERIYVETSFGKTHMLVTGPQNGKPLFILQGGNCINPMTLSWFLPLIEQYRIYAPDTIGHPGFSAEARISAKDNSFAQWLIEMMDYLNIESSAFIGPSYGGGIIFRLAAYMPNKIDCAVLVSPAGIQLGSKREMIKKILIPLLLFKATSSENYLTTITNIMSANSMQDIDKQIIGEIFQTLKLEQEMPKLTEKKELIHYNAPTLIIAGEDDIFFPQERLYKKAKDIIPNLTAFKTLKMGHFPSQEHTLCINNEIRPFLNNYY